LVLKSGEVIELRNIAADPLLAFDVDGRDMIAHEEDAVATWHTHPFGKSEMSADDMIGFLMWPHLLHYVISPEGVRCYRVKNGAVLHDEG
jgi:proteasome lid subunit RPN8/RPN11